MVHACVSVIMSPYFGAKEGDVMLLLSDRYDRSDHLVDLCRHPEKVAKCQV
jgi:hypothetical protein